MYFYILDSSQVPQRDFERQQAELQSLLTEYKINGEMAKITPLRLIPDLVDSAAARGVKTLVACGTDETFHEMLSYVKDRDFTFGFIPFVPNTQLGKILGFEDLATCVKTIASRRIEKIDVAKIKDHFFISYLELGAGVYTNKNLGNFAAMRAFSQPAFEIKMRIDDSYTITSNIVAGLIINTRGTGEPSGSMIANPQDNFLDLLLIEKISRLSILKYKNHLVRGSYEYIPGATSIRCKKIELLEPFGTKVSLNAKEIMRIPAVVEILPSSLRMIVGKNRTF